MVITPTSVFAQANFWINPASGTWEDASSWSLGAPPGTGQMVFVANYGWKAVSIDNNTAVNFPQTMSIDVLTVVSPGTDTVNTVLLNYAGLQTPLAIANYLYVSNNADMVILQSALQVANEITAAGTVTEDASSQVSAGALAVLGAYYFTNGILSVSGNTSVVGQFVQAGGSNFCGSLSLTGEFDLSGGQLVVPAPTSSGPDGILDFGNFVQSGGSVGNWILSVGQSGLSGGTYHLNGGFLNVYILNLPALPGNSVNPDSSYMIQTDGTNEVSSLNVGADYNGNPAFGYGTYSLSNGLLTSDSVTIEGEGNFYQYGGVHNCGSMTIWYSDQTSATPPHTNYSLPGHYYLNGGTFTATTLGISTGQLILTGGQLTVSNMALNSGGNFLQSGGTVTQSGTLLLADAGLTAGPGAQQFGELQLEWDTSSTSVLTFAPGASMLHFANSSSLIWSNTSVLVISNWNGSLSGGGEDQIFFGSDNTGLTPQQLSQVQFFNPAGLPSGTYSVQILPDGEVVPKLGSSNSGLVNSWINPTSGNWEDATSWSLGVPPGSSQSVLITNSGFKAVAIQSSTATDFPQTLSVNSVTITSPTNSANTLLMNYAGAGNPLVIGVDSNNPGSLIIGDTNSTMAMYSSGLIVNDALGTSNQHLGEFEVEGTFNQSDNSEVVAGFLDLTNNGTYNLTNGEVFIGTQFINGTFNQQGGTNTGSLEMDSTNGHYEIFDGVFQGDMTLYSGTFGQSGGTVSARLTLDSGGLYHLAGGVLLPGDLNLGAAPVTNGSISPFGGGIVQTGGTNSANSVTMALGYYEVDGGTLSAGTFTVTTNAAFPEDLLAASFAQSGGYVTNGQTILIGGENIDVDSTVSGTYDLYGGTLETPLIVENKGAFNQNSGTTNLVGTLSMSNASMYVFNGGLLEAGDIQINNALFSHYGGSLAGPMNLSMANGAWLERTNGTQFGQLQLLSGSGSGLYLPSPPFSPSGPCVVQFADSSGVAWASDGAFTIAGWVGSPNGGGLHQIYFGTSASGLTTQQLSQVQFANPAGQPVGTYPARILSDGEVVPVSGPVVPPTLRLSLASQEYGPVSLTLTGNVDAHYVIEISTNLQNWTVLTNVVTGNNGTLYIDDWAYPQSPIRFYRALLSP